MIANNANYGEAVCSMPESRMSMHEELVEMNSRIVRVNDILFSILGQLNGGPDKTESNKKNPECLLDAAEDLVIMLDASLEMVTDINAFLFK